MFATLITKTKLLSSEPYFRDRSNLSRPRLTAGYSLFNNGCLSHIRTFLYCLLCMRRRRRLCRHCGPALSSQVIRVDDTANGQSTEYMEICTHYRQRRRYTTALSCSDMSARYLLFGYIWVTSENYAVGPEKNEMSVYTLYDTLVYSPKSTG